MVELEINLSRCQFLTLIYEDKKISNQLVNSTLKEKLGIRFNLKGVHETIFNMIKFPSNILNHRGENHTER